MYREAHFAALDRRLADWEGTMIDVIGDLARQNSFSENRDGGQIVGTMLDDLFRPAGLESQVFESTRHADHRAWSSVSSVGLPVLLVGHFDTVFPPGIFDAVRMDGDLLRGPGVLDMKGGLVVVAFALRALAEVVGLDRINPVRVIAVADEEVGSHEGKDVIRSLAHRADAALVFEAGRAQDRIVTARKGTGMVTVRARGRAAHAGANHADGVNAIWGLSRWIDGAHGVTDYGRGITVTVGLISGGTAHNVIPAECTSEVDFRFESKEDGEAVLAQFRALAGRVQQAMPGLTIEVQGRINRLPLERSLLGGILMRDYAVNAKSVGLGGDEATLVGGASDANTTAALRIATIDGLGPRGKGFHTLDEQIEVESLVLKARALARFLLHRATRNSRA